MHTVSDNEFEISIANVGAELSSIKSIKTGKEYIWQADASIWGSHAPVLFPIIGCLKDDFYFFNGKKYTISKHGFIRNNKDLKVIEKTKNSIEFQLINNHKTIKMYPFKFDFRIKFKIIENKITIEHRVINLDHTNPIYFSLGGHPAFNCPIDSNEKYTDFYLEFDQSESLDRWNVNSAGLIKNDPITFLSNEKIIQLSHELFNHDALIFKHLVSKKISLKSKKSLTKITVEFDDFNYLGIWAKPNGDFVCIEPWLGISDNENTNNDFTKKEGIIKLDGNKEFKASYSITINEY